MGDFIYGANEGLFIGVGRLSEAAYLTDVLEGGGANVFARNIFLKWRPECLDTPAHILLLLLRIVRPD